MPPVPNHYELLKVSRDARVEVIRAAYKELARKHHPDRNSNSSESHRAMQMLNSAFEILNDPARRSTYDRSLAELENHRREPPLFDVMRRWFAPHGLTDRVRGASLTPVRKMTAQRWVARLAFAALLLWALNLDREPTLHADTPLPALAEHVANPLSSHESDFQKPENAPNGSAWPKTAGEIDGYRTDDKRGKSTLTLDNSRNGADVFVKLYRLQEGGGRSAVRHVYIGARASLELSGVAIGSYEVRYQDLNSGLFARSETFEVVEKRTNSTVSYSVLKITLARITPRSLEGFRILPHEF